MFIQEILKRYLHRKTGPKRKWYEDLCDYYGVTPEQAMELGKRSETRRPNLPGSATTHPVSGKTLHEIWKSEPRDTIKQVLKWQKDQGAWSSFRQLYYHRKHQYDRIIRGLPPKVKYCEYACGTAPISNWIVSNIKDKIFDITIVDVDCEHRTFGEWRLRRNIERSGRSFSLQALVVDAESLILKDEYDMISIIEALVLIHNPYEVIKHLTEHLKTGGKLWETYTILDDYRTRDYLSFKRAQEQRPFVFKYIRENYRLISGPDPNVENDSGRRCWKKL